MDASLEFSTNLQDSQQKYSNSSAISAPNQGAVGSYDPQGRLHFQYKPSPNYSAAQSPSQQARSNLCNNAILIIPNI